MPILRGFTGDIRTMPPDIYVNEMPVPQEEYFNMPDFVLGFVGEFDRGPVNEYVYASETPAKRLIEILRPVLGEACDNGKSGNQLLVHINQAKVRKAVFVRVLGNGYATSSLTLNDNQDIPEPILKVKAKYPGKYANIFTAEVAKGSSENTFKLILTSDLDGKETYDNLNMDKKSKNYVLNIINNKSYHFVIEDLIVDEVDINTKIPVILEQTQLTGGSNGSDLTDVDYIGRYDNGLNSNSVKLGIALKDTKLGIDGYDLSYDSDNLQKRERTGLKLLELAGKRITDFAYINYSSATSDKALYAMAEKYNSFCYCGTNNNISISDMISYRKIYNTDFMQMTAGKYYANTGAEISGACLSAIVHVVGKVQDSGLAKECIWVSRAEQEYDFDDNSILYQNQIACFTLKPSETGNANFGWRMGNDYTLAITDVDGEIMTDNENRKVNKRRLNSWIENSLFFVAAKWQGKALTDKMRSVAEIRIRTFFDNLKNPINPLDEPKIDNYQVLFDDKALTIDAFVQYLKVKHFNTAEWILLNYQGGTNVEVAK